MDEYQTYSEIVRDNIDMDSLVQRYPYEQDRCAGHLSSVGDAKGIQIAVWNSRKKR